MDWLYDNEEHVYREEDEGLEVDAVLLIALRDSLAEALRDDAAELAQKLAAGDLTVQEWVLAMRNLLEQAYLEQYALGKGGTNNLFAADLATLGLMLDAQYRYLQNFAEKVAAGELSAEQTAARAQLYMSSSTQAFERGNGAARGLPVLPQYPGDGRTQCRTNCKCNWRIVEYEDRWECFWELNPAEHCKDCVENSRRWKPLVLAKAQANSLATVEQLLPGALTGTYVAGVPITPTRSGNGIARGNAHG